jgi:hypothetical protein
MVDQGTDPSPYPVRHLLPSIRFHYTPWEVLVEAMTGSDKDKTKSQVQ